LGLQSTGFLLAVHPDSVSLPGLGTNPGGQPALCRFGRLAGKPLETGCVVTQPLP
jgi:hypothetical protein